MVSHSSKPTRGEAYELLVLDAENTVIPLFFVLINLAQSLNPNYLTENVCAIFDGSKLKIHDQSSLAGRIDK